MKKLVRAYVDEKEMAREIARTLLDRKLATSVEIVEVEVYDMDDSTQNTVERLTNKVTAICGEANTGDCIEVFEGCRVYRDIEVLPVDK